MRSITALLLTLVFALELLGTTTASVDITALVYEYEQSGKWNFELWEQNVTKTGGQNMKYELTTNAQKDLKLDNTINYDMVLFGTHAIGGWSTYHLEGVEEDLIKYVEGGGFILVQTSDDTFYKGTMFPVELRMRESSDHEFEVTSEGKKLGIFEKPNKISNVIYDKVEEPWVVLANSKDSDYKACYELLALTPCLQKRKSTPNQRTDETYSLPR
ncbi:hypothetical protein FJZ31_01705 [Candidatus Poribacteria bacterium]|nr:hypothetical protein [Candidatus Poribacteria bacterium]